jgi:hypothetical protein
MNKRNSLAQTLSEEEYIALRGERCPNCASSCIEGDSIEIGGNGASQSIRCLECDATWVDVYVLSGYEFLEVPEE